MYKIKCLALVALVVLISGVISSVAAQRVMEPSYISPPEPINDALRGSYYMKVSGNELSAGEVEPISAGTYGWTCSTKTEGDLSGYMFISLNYDSSGSQLIDESSFDAEKRTVTGGSWSKLIFVKGEYVGSIFGKIVGGELLTSKRDYVSISLQLSSDDGTEAFVGSVGSGTFEGVIDRNSKVPSVSGELILNY